jgi:acetate kinase
VERLSAVLALNCGSSSLKFGVYCCERDGATLLCEGEAEEIGKPHTSFWVKGAEETERRTNRVALPDHAAALTHALQALTQCHTPEPTAVGHRFVHGGPTLREHQRVTTDTVEQLRAAVDYAPLHLPPALAVLDAVWRIMPAVPQVVCFDTAFHRRMPDLSKTYALPLEVRRLGVERYGFHGLSLESIMAQLHNVPEKLVVAHLGNGSSITAIRQGESVDTSMGLTPSGGVMMGTRCGDLDPGIAVYLMRHGYGDPGALEKLIDKQSGLLGVSGKSSDVRELLEARNEDPQADLALRMFCYQVRKTIAAMSAAMNGVDTLVLTGGIGEHAAELRTEICSGLQFLGNFQTLVLPSQEDLQIANITANLM